MHEALSCEGPFNKNHAGRFWPEHPSMGIVHAS
jgi:hypothetical protein